MLLQHSTAYSAVQRIQGFVDTIKDKPQYRVVERIECEGQLEIAMPKMDAFLNKDSSFDVVMAERLFRSSHSSPTMGKDAAEIVYKILENKPYSSKARIPVTLINENNIDQFSLEGWQ